MVSGSDVKYKKSQGVGLGGAKSATLINTANPNNLFDTVSGSQANSGLTEYRCFYIENGHATEDMDDVDVFLSSDNPNSAFSTVQWGFEPYRYTPFGTFNGTSDFFSEPDDTDLRLTRFTIAVWFKTNTVTGDRYLVAKGGVGVDTPTNNDNYSLRLTSTFTIEGGFEETNGANHYVESVLTYNDDKWHFAVVQYDGITLSLFIDDMINAVDTLATTATPETNAHPLTVGRNSRAADKFWEDNLDEVRVWNKALTQTERQDLYNWGKVPTSGKVYENKFGDDTFAVVAQTIGSETTAPLGVNWLGVTNGPININPNVGILEPGFHVPIWIKWLISPNSPDAANDHCVLEVQGKIPSGGTGGGGSVPPPAPSAFTFVVVGDWGCTSTTTDVVDLIEDINPQVVCSVGDNSYDPSISCFLSRIAPIDHNQGSDILFLTAFGNHDNAESEDASTETATLNHFGISRTYNRLTVENVCFVFIDNTEETDFAVGSAQHTQVSTWLAEARANPVVDWIVVIVHKPMFGASSEHGYNTGNFNQAYGPLFNTHKVDLVVTGHNHNWQQTDMVTYNSSSPTTPTVTDSSSPYTGGSGFVHCVSGGGGHDSGSSLYSLGSQPSFQNYQSDEHNGVLKCVLSNNNLTLTCSFVDIDGTTDSTFVINR